MEFSEFGKKFTDKAGILSLMDDMGKAMGGGRDVIMMGGGNPGYVPEFQEIVRHRLLKICADRREFQRLVGIYNPPQGEQGFIENLAGLLQREYGWQHKNECLRVTYSQDERQVAEGITRIAEEVRRAFSEAESEGVSRVLQGG